MPASLLIEPRPSRIWLGAWLSVSVVVGFLLLLSNSTLAVQVFVASFAGFGVLRVLRAAGWLHGTRLSSVAHGEQGWRLRHHPAAGWEAVDLLPDYVVWPALIVLRFRNAAGGYTAMVLLADSLPPDTFRRLRVLLRWHPDLAGSG